MLFAAFATRVTAAFMPEMGQSSSYICAPLDNRDIKIYNMHGDRVLRFPRNSRSLVGHRRLVTSVASHGNLLFSASFDKSLVNLATGGQDHVTLRLTAPPGSLPGAVSEWRVCVATALGLPLGVARFGARVTGTPKVIYVAVDGLNKEYLELNRAGTATGTSGDWLLPNLRNFKERGTWYINARAMMPFVTDPNHIAAVTGCNPGMNGVPGVMMFDMGRKPDGENVARMIDDITPEYLHSGIDGQRVKSIFDVAKAANPNAFTAYVTSKNWMNYFFRNRLTGEGVDRVLTGRVVPPYIEDPPHHVFGDPETDDAATDPYYDVLLHNFGYASGSLPSDAWMFDST